VKCATDFGVEVSYAAKAFATVEFLRYLARYPIGVDVCSLGELVTAQRAGFKSERITLHGAGKSDEELLSACTGRIGCVAVDGIAELQRLADISRNGYTASVMLRLNVGVDASTHAFVRTGGKDSKFGIHQRDERAAASLLSANPQLHFAGVHAHIGSQIYDESAYLENASALVAAAQRFASFGLRSERIVIGGGFGVPSDPAATIKDSTSPRPSPPRPITFATRRKDADSSPCSWGSNRDVRSSPTRERRSIASWP
jgi:diaminopimelate decarboxylase